MRNFQYLRLLSGLAMSACVLSGTARAQEPDAVQLDDVLQLAGDEDVVFVAAKVAAPAWWLGLQTEAVSDPVLRKQLGLGEHGLVVIEVLPGSPAAKAGLEQHDILIDAAGVELRTVDDLLAAVAKHGGKSLSISLLRNGKKTTVEAKPGKRPQDDDEDNVERPQRFNVEVHTENAKKAIDELMGELHKHGAPGAMQFRVVGPGVVGPGVVGARAMAGAAELPKDVKITISRQGSEPAQVTVKRGDKTWEATADKLDAIPEDLRRHVEPMLGQGMHWTYRFEDKLPAEVRERFMKWTMPLPPGAAMPVPGKANVRVHASVENTKPKADSSANSGLADVQREVARLREELAALRKEISSRANERESLEKLLRRLIEEQKK